MARLWTSSWGLNTLTDQVEWAQFTPTDLSIVANAIHTGENALRYLYASTTGGKAVQKQIYTVGGDAGRLVYIRCYIKIAQMFNQNVMIVGSNLTGIGLKPDGTLCIMNFAGTDLGFGASAALSLNTVYCLEFLLDASGATTAYTARLNFSQFASGATAADTFGTAQIGPVPSGALSQGDIYFGGVAVNDDVGSFQNTWPGDERIAHIVPDGAGANAQWTKLGSAPAATNWQGVNEIPPDDAVTYNGASTIDKLDDYAITTPAAIASGDTINCVAVGQRFRRSSAVFQSRGIALRITAGGVTEESSALTLSVASTNWFSNNGVEPKVPQLVLYDMPGASTTPMTKSDLDSAEIGLRCVAGPGANQVQVSNEYLIVGYTTPAVAGRRRGFPQVGG